MSNKQSSTNSSKLSSTRSRAAHLLFGLLFTDAEQARLYRAVEDAEAVVAVDIGAHATVGTKHTERILATVHRGLNSAFIIAGILPASYQKALYRLCRNVGRCNHRVLSEHGEALLKLYPSYRAEIAQLVQTIKRRWRGGEPPRQHSTGTLGGAIGIACAELPPPIQNIYKTYSLFFPQGAKLLTSDLQQQFKQLLRLQRTVTIVSKNQRPLSHPLTQILFTSNVLMTVPKKQGNLQRYPAPLQQQIRAAAGEPQCYWYDHPIAVGSDTQSNELLYGLRGLSNMVRYEIEHNRLSPDTCISVLLSVSTTHEGLRPIAADIIRCDIADSEPIPHINAWIFTEKECQAIVDGIVAPALTGGTNAVNGRLHSNLSAIFGVDGEYGRHYTTLKAIAPLWSLLQDDRITATFKIDLDQVFPQQQLVAETGGSASEHFMTDIWGADGIDCDGGSVHLGLIAGALVNEQDIEHGIFTPDVHYDLKDLHQLTLPQRIFNTAIPQSVSTAVEMGDDDATEADSNNVHLGAPVSTSATTARFTSHNGSGHQVPHQIAVARQRIHVTGGTNGITVEALRRFRPFTPIDCGRAEDQAYLLSVLYQPVKTADGRGSQFLRYAHKAGLIMRHDKSSLIPATLNASKIPNKIGDIIRILFYSSYAQVVPGGMLRVAKATSPFTGSFISPIPHALGYLTWGLSIEHHFGNGEYDAAMEFVSEGVGRLPIAHDRFTVAKQKNSFVFHRKAWHTYYKALDMLERHKTGNRPLFQRCKDSWSTMLGPVRIL